MTTDMFKRAEQFIWKNARLLERRLFAYHFKGGSRDSVVTALLAYQNSDGGFGQALEPDIRDPNSQPVPVQHALEILDVLGLVCESGVVQQICDYLLTITCPSGGVPWLLPSAMSYPRAPWWQTDANPPASLNPTAAIAGLLHKYNVPNEWLAQATEYCWSEIEELSPNEMHSMGVVLTFLYHVPDRLRATAQLDRLIDLMLAGDLVADIDAEGYVRKPLDWAPLPNHPLRRYGHACPPLLFPNHDRG